MAEAKAMAKSIRVSPRKARLVIDLIRGKKVGEAVGILHTTKSTATESISHITVVVAEKN